MPVVPPTASRHRFVVEAILFLTYACFGLSWIGVTPLVGALQGEFHVRSATVALLNTVVAAAKVVGPLVTGLVAVRIGLKRAALVGAACIVAAAAVPFAPSFGVALAARFVFGLGGAVVVTLLGPLVMGWFDDRERPLVNALNNVAVNTGVAVTLFTTTPLAARFGWRGALLVYAAASLALAVAWALLGRDAPSTQPLARAARAGSARYRDLWRRRETWLVTVGFMAPLALYLAYNTWLPRHLVEARGFAPAAAAHVMGLCNLVGIPAALVGGVGSAKLGARRPFLLVAGVAIGAGALGLLLAHGTAALAASAIVLGIALFLGSSPLLTTAMELPGMTPQHVSLMMGTVLSGAYLVSSLSPVLVGALRDRTGSFVPGLAFWAVASWTLLLPALLLPETGRRARRAGVALADYDAIASRG